MMASESKPNWLRPRRNAIQLAATGPEFRMLEVMISFFVRAVRVAAAAGLCSALVVAVPVPARARVFVGVGVGVPFYGYGPYVPPPIYYPPPMYYAPPPVYYAPPRVYAPPPPPPPPGRQACYAAAYVCPMERPVAPGSACYCAGNDGQRVWGRAN